MENFDIHEWQAKFLTESTLDPKEIEENRLRNLAAGAAMALGTLGAYGQEAPAPRDYQKSIDSLKTVTDKTPQEKRALTTDFVKKRNAQRLAPVTAAQEKRIKDWIAAYPGPAGESYEDGAKRYWKDQEKRQSGPEAGLPGLGGGTSKAGNSCRTEKGDSTKRIR